MTTNKEIMEIKVAFESARTHLSVALNLIELGAYQESEVPLADLRAKCKEKHEALREVNHGYF